VLIDLSTVSPTSEAGTKDGPKETKGGKDTEGAKNIEGKGATNNNKTNKETITTILGITPTSIPTSRDNTSNNPYSVVRREIQALEL
jgi:hypothetical protein